MSEPYLGEIRMFGGTFAPLGWNFCDGTLLPISQNEALFTLCGTSYGGDGTVTFALPDLRSRVPIHQGTGRGLSTYVIGQVGGVESVTLLTNQIPSHTHTLSASLVAGTVADPTNNVIATAKSDCKVFAPTAQDTTYNAAHVAPGGGGSQPHENRQSFVAINYIIALAGIFPQQS